MGNSSRRKPAPSKSAGNAKTAKNATPKTARSPKGQSSLPAQLLLGMLKSNPDLISKFLSTDLDALKALEERTAGPARRKSKRHNHSEPEEEQGDEGEEDEGEYEGNDVEDGEAGSESDNGDEEHDSARDYQDDEDDGISEDEREPSPPPKVTKKRAAPKGLPEKPSKKQRVQQVHDDLVPSVTIGQSKDLLRPLPPRRSSGAPGRHADQPTTAPESASAPGRSKTPPPTHQAAAVPPSTPEKRGQHASATTQPPGASTSNVGNTPAVLETPYNRRVNPRREREILEGLLSPTSKYAFDTIKARYLVFVLTENGFPTLEQTEDYLNAHLPQAFEAARKADKKQRLARLSDKAFVLDMTKLLHGKTSGIRNHLVNAAKDVVVTHYKLNSFKTRRDRKREIKRLLNRASFVHTDPKNTDEGMFEHPAIRAVIEKAFFRSSKPAYNLGRVDKFKTHFNPFPNKLIVLAAVAIQCALDQWKDGTFQQLNFDGNVYGKEYLTLNAKLTEFLDDPDTNEYFFLLRADWYDEARDATAAYNSESDAADDSDNEATVTKNRAAVRAALAARRAEQARAAAETRDGEGPSTSND